MIMLLMPMSIGLCLAADQAKVAPKTDPLKAKPEVVEAWKDMRFGMFISWGPVTLTGQEIGHSRGVATWGMREGVFGGRGRIPAEVYDNLYKKWKPEKFEAREWIKIAQDAGARYVIFLVKHHDGFCLYDSKLTDYKSTGAESAWKVDYLKEIADASHKADIKLIVYYSQPDWHHFDFCGEHHERYIRYLHGQVREILTNYGRIEGIWFDGLGGSAEQWDTPAMFAMMRSLQPNLIINNRAGIAGDYATPEQLLGAFNNTSPWESCITLGTQWSWKPDDTIKSLKECIVNLVSCATGDGNLALNTGPMPDGRIEPRQAERYREIGAWLKKHGESIYGTRGGPFRAPLITRIKGRAAKDSALPGDVWQGGSTHQGNNIYLHVFHWPETALALPPIGHKILGATVLTGGEAEVKQTTQGIDVQVATKWHDPIDTIVKLELDGPATDIPVAKSAVVDSGSLALGKKATASSSSGEIYAPAMAFDGDPGTRWAWDPKDTEAWLAVDLGAPKTFDHAWLSERGFNSWVSQYELQVKDREEDPWRTFHQGTTIGKDCEIKFAPVTGRYVRLNLIEFSKRITPAFWEFQIYAPEPTEVP